MNVNFVIELLFSFKLFGSAHFLLYVIEYYWKNSFEIRKILWKTFIRLKILFCIKVILKQSFVLLSSNFWFFDVFFNFCIILVSFYFVTNNEKIFHLKLSIFIFFSLAYGNNLFFNITLTPTKHELIRCIKSSKFLFLKLKRHFQQRKGISKNFIINVFKKTVKYQCRFLRSATTLRILSVPRKHIYKVWALKKKLASVP